MSAGGAFGGARGYQPKPPDKGVFPLDHFGECKAVRAHTSSGSLAPLAPLAPLARQNMNTPCARLVQVKEQYLACLKENASQAEGCRKLAKTYLECRMERCPARGLISLSSANLFSECSGSGTEVCAEGWCC
jgi:hypothetical protein